MMNEKEGKKGRRDLTMIQVVRAIGKNEMREALKKVKNGKMADVLMMY